MYCLSHIGLQFLFRQTSALILILVYEPPKKAIYLFITSNINLDFLVIANLYRGEKKKFVSYECLWAVFATIS